MNRIGMGQAGNRRNVVAMGLVSLFTDFASTLVTPILPLFIVVVLDEGADKVGYVTAAATFVSYVLRLVGGVLSDRFAYNKPFLLIGYGISAVAKPFFAYSNGWASIAGIRAFERLGKAVRAAPKDRLISQSAEKSQTGKSFGLHKTLDVTGEVGGLIAAFVVIVVYGSGEAVFRNLFRLSLIPGIIAMLILAFFVRDVTGGKRRKPIRFAVEKRLRFPIVVFAAFALFMFSEAFFVLRAEESGIVISGILLLLIAAKLTQVVLSYRVGMLLDQVEPQRVLTVGYGVGVLALLALFVDSTVMLLIAFVLYGVHVVVTLNGVRVIIGRNAQDKGATFGLFYLLYAIASTSGALLIGILWQRFGMTVALQFSLIGTAAIFAVQLQKTVDSTLSSSSRCG